VSTAQPNLNSAARLVQVEATETVQQVNARGPMAADQFLKFAAINGRCELLQGKVQMMSPAGSEHGYIAAQIAYLLIAHVRQQRLGRVYAAETGFVIARSPDTVRSPDIAYITKERLAVGGEGRGFGEVVPDLVIEVLSPSDRIEDVNSKTRSWLDAGVRCVVNVDPETQSVAVHQANVERTFEIGSKMEYDDVVPGWYPTVQSFFESDL